MTFCIYVHVAMLYIMLVVTKKQSCMKYHSNSLYITGACMLDATIHNYGYQLHLHIHVPDRPVFALAEPMHAVLFGVCN